MELLRKKDVVDLVGAAKSTVSDWIIDYAAFVPTVQQGNKTYYRVEAVEVLKAVKEMRDRDVSKTQIAEELAKQFPIDADIMAGTIEKARLGETDKSDAMITVMATMSKVFEHMERQDERIRRQDEQVAIMAEEVIKVSEGIQKELAASREKTEELEKKIRELQEEKAKGFWGKLFSK